METTLEAGDKVADLAFGIRDDRMLLLLQRFSDLSIMPMKTCQEILKINGIRIEIIFKGYECQLQSCGKVLFEVSMTKI